MLKPLIIALQLLTRLPVPAISRIAAEDLGRSPLYYPIAGLIIGTLLALANHFMFALSIELTAALLLIIWIMLTGALHLDGLADSADAWLGGYGDRARTLSIMKDPACGPAGVVAIVTLLLVKYAALQQVTEFSNWEYLVAAAVIGRVAILALFLTTPYVREHGMGSTITQALPRKPAWAAIFISLTLLISWLHILGVVLMLTGLIGFLLLRQLMQRRIGGSTGDTTGAMVEIIETLVLIVAISY